jgi:adenylosuccinate synthase
VPKLIIVLSGPVGSGKSTLATALASEFVGSVFHIKTHQCLSALNPDIPKERKALQEYGEQLDRTTGGEWVVRALHKAIISQGISDGGYILLDAARIRGQIEGIRKGYGRRVLHIHLTAPTNVLAARYKARTGGPIKELKSYRDVLANPTEKAVPELAHIADIVIDSAQNMPRDIVTRAACHIGLYGRDYRRLVDVVVGGQYGSEGKGQIAAHIAPEYDVLVRVGGPNAGHSVFEDSRISKFHHIPSGARANPNAQLIFGAGGVLNPKKILDEANQNEIDIERLAIDPQAMVITEKDIQDEIALTKGIGSTGQGVGAATARKIMGRLPGERILARDVPELKPYLRDTGAMLDRAFWAGKKVLLEGTQGTGLSLHHGPYPFVTSRDTTVAGCLAEAGISPSRVRKVVMVCRSYPIRVQNPDHGTSGELVQELTWKEIAKRAHLDPKKLEQAEMTTTTHRKRRVCEFDWALLRKSASLNAPTDIALTFSDYLHKDNRDARRFEQLDKDTIRFIEEMERIAAAPVSLISTRFHYHGIIDRRAW